MPYDYATQRKVLFTESGFKTYNEVRDEALRILDLAGAFRASSVMKSGDTWTILAVLDYMVETKQLIELTNEHQVRAQDRVFMDVPKGLR